VWHTRSEEETISAGTQLARRLPARAVMLLIGNLGAGKTTLAKGILLGLGVASPDEVTSPTFTLVHEYRGTGRVAYHIDLYRLDAPEQVDTLGLDDLFEQDAVVLIEWGERFPDRMPDVRWEVRISGTGESRIIEVKQPAGEG
jgi:tRNA threonylcarbamoyladenosine biosynthesis protein TsaE